MDTMAKDAAYVANTYARFPMAVKSGKGSTVLAEDGKEYIDLTAGIAVTSFGMADDEWIAAVEKQLHSFQHTSNLYYTAPCAQLAQVLCEKTGFQKVFFGNSGAEANECAVKVARKYGSTHKGKDCNQIITLKNSFHGRTLTTLAATGQEVFHQDFLPLTEGFLYAEAGDLEAIKAYIDKKNVCAVMMELIQGEGGVNVLEPGFVKAVASLCQKEDVLLIIDEVQTGNGRTGKLYAYMNYGIMPDVVTTAKGLGGGLPIGACLLGEKVKDILTPGSHGSTFGGNPVCCAGALSVLSRLTDTFLEEVTKKGNDICEQLQGCQGVKSISGLGLMIGIETEKPAKQVASQALEKGLMVLTAKNKVRLLPALNITKEELEKAIGILRSCL